MSGSSTSCTNSGEVSLIYIKRKHGVVLLHGGHQYYVKKKYPSGLSLWECSQRKKKCKGVIKIRNNNIVNETPHLCTPDFLKNEIDERLYSCKQEIIKGNYPAVPQSYNNMIATLENSGLDLVCKIPTFNSVKSSLYRFRNAQAGVQCLQPQLK
ncbi:uncharacterized protein LOC142985914 [Anticarsia gemmatalis]|uniref:uncharacterized protein LOC142985914 n=1 Tax=Anticarsia gemmatalis TaxID=129554 RepID=UPI003F76C792